MRRRLTLRFAQRRSPSRRRWRCTRPDPAADLEPRPCPTQAPVEARRHRPLQAAREPRLRPELGPVGQLARRPTRARTVAGTTRCPPSSACGHRCSPSSSSPRSSGSACSSSPRRPRPRTRAPPSTRCRHPSDGQVGQVQPDMGNQHVQPGDKVTYAVCPPASGKHINKTGYGPLQPKVYGPDDQSAAQRLGAQPGARRPRAALLLHEGRLRRRLDRRPAGRSRAGFPASAICEHPGGRRGAGRRQVRRDADEVRGPRLGPRLLPRHAGRPEDLRLLPRLRRAGRQRRAPGSRRRSRSARPPAPSASPGASAAAPARPAADRRPACACTPTTTGSATSASASWCDGRLLTGSQLEKRGGLRPDCRHAPGHRLPARIRGELAARAVGARSEARAEARSAR